jgi:hypothetical protein
MQDQAANSKVLGRIVVHDRVQVESNVLPRYFNHSSFASLRRQLNYFNFVRLGKGRQRESTYINENVIELDDILHLKRRPTTCTMQDTSSFSKSQFFGARVGQTHALKVTSSSDSGSDTPLLERRTKRRRQTIDAKPTTVSPRSTSPVEQNFASETYEYTNQNSFVVLDLTTPEFKPDADVMDGCRSLLFLSAKGW